MNELKISPRRHMLESLDSVIDYSHTKDVYDIIILGYNNGMRLNTFVNQFTYTEMTTLSMVGTPPPR